LTSPAALVRGPLPRRRGDCLLAFLGISPETRKNPEIRNIMTKGPRRLFINSVSIFGGEIFARLATAFMALLVARVFGAEELGSYGYALALASVLLIVPDFGLHLFAVRELAASPQRTSELFWGVHWLKFGLTGAVVIFTLSFGAWGITDRERRVVFYILMIRALLQSFSQATMAVFKAFERMHYVALVQLANSSVVIVWAASSVLSGARLPIVIAGLVAGQITETCLGWGILRRFSPRPRFRLCGGRALAQIAAACFPFGLTAILLALNLRVDVLVLGRYVSSGELGQFNAAAWFVIAAFLTSSLLMSVLFPRLSRLLLEPSPQASDYVLSLLKNALLITALGSLAVWLSAPRLLPLVFGPDFAPAAHLLRILAPALPLVVLNTIFFYVFAAARRRFVCLGTLALGVAGGALLSLYWTSRHGAAGAASADVVREFVVSSVYLFFLIQGNHARVAGFALLKVFLGATASLAAAVLLGAFPQIEVVGVAAWMFFILVGTIGVLGLPKSGEWRLLTDDRL
jgi:O-antigen/teichoic acid export membrane protein